MDLDEDLKSEIKNYPLDSALALTQENKLYIIPRTSENENWFRKNEIYAKVDIDGCEALTDEELQIISDDFPNWTPSCGLDRGRIATDKNVTTVDISHLIK